MTVMRIKRGIVWLTGVFIFSLFAVSFAGAGEGKISGYLFGDYYWMAQNHDPDLEGKNGLWIRRIYFTYDKDLSDTFTTRLRLEFNGKGDFTTKAKLVPFINDAYLRWKPNRHSAYLGISPTPTWDLVEKHWGYRSVEKTPLDLQKFGSSHDFGVALKGVIDEGGIFSYHFMFANGEGTSGAEIDTGKKFMLALTTRPTDPLVFQVYGDLDENDGASEDIRTYQAFVGWSADRGRAGLLFAQQVREDPSGSEESLEILSVHGAAELREKLSAFARVDRMFDANSKGDQISYIPFDTTSKSILVIGGLDYTPIESVHVLPNVEAVFYDDSTTGTDPESDLIPRLTLYYEF